jgi:integral membrane protein (TIGR00529 family)
LSALSIFHIPHSDFRNPETRNPQLATRAGMLSQIPALIRVTIVFVLVLIAIRKKLSLGNSFLLGALAMGALFGEGPHAIASSILRSLLDPKTASLAIIVELILILSNSMEKAGQMQRLLSSFRGLVSSPRLNLTIFPALIGLLPMPGGAVFSAPMVKELGAQSKLSSGQLSFVNYWFRHIWEYWWPLYPGVLLTVVLADISLSVYVLSLAPLTVAAILFGQGPIKIVKKSNPQGHQTRRPPILPFLKELTPVLIVIVPGLSTGLLLSRLFPAFPTGKETGLIVCLGAAIFWIWQKNNFSGRQIRDVLLDKHLLNLFYMVAAIFIFKGILSDSQAVNAISNELISLKIPLLIIIALLPFLVGMIAGITIAFVGSTFPILIPMIHSMGETQHMLAYIMLAMVCGFAGVLLSPLHLCLVLSNEYFQTKLSSVYRYLWFPCTALVLSAFGYFGLLHWGRSISGAFFP